MVFDRYFSQSIDTAKKKKKKKKGANSDHISLWKSKGLSYVKIKPPAASNKVLLWG